jgi:Tol biopolymer transport system component
MARILEREPDWEPVEAVATPPVTALLRRCLRKDASRRLRDIGDARIEIEEALEGGAPESLPTPVERRPGLPVLAAVGLVFALAGAAVAWLALRGGTAPASSELKVGQVARLTHDPGLSEWPTWSPDASLLAFASNRDGDFEIYVRRVDGGQEVNVTDDDGQDFQPAFSADGNQIAFISTRSSRTGMIKIGALFGMEFRTLGGDLWVVPALGGQPRRLARDANFPIWHPDGDRIFYVSGPENHRSIREVALADGSTRTLLDESASRWEMVRLRVSPGGSWITFETTAGGIWAMPDGGGEPRLLLPGLSHVWDPSGERLYFLTRDPSGGTRLKFVEMDEAGGTTRGEAKVFGLMTGVLRDLALANDGRSLAVSELEGSLNLTLLPLNAEGDGPAGPEQVVSGGEVIDRYPEFSPDGRKIAYSSDRLGGMEIWIADLDTGERRQLYRPGDDQGANLPHWTPDGEKLVMTRFLEGNQQSIWLHAVDGSEARELIPPGRGVSEPKVSPDGWWLSYVAEEDGHRQLFVLDLEGGESRQVTSSPWDTQGAVWSPDGRWIAMVSSQSGAYQVWRMPAAGGEPVQLTTGNERIRHVFHSSDGRWIYFQPSHRNIYRVPAAGGTVEQVTDFPESGLFIEEPTLSPDGRTLAYCRSNGGSSLWVLTLDSGE